MISNPISATIAGQIPEHVRSDSPLFVAFLEAYYRYAEQRTKGVGIIQSRNLDNDIDFTLDDYVTKFYTTYGQFLPQEIAMDKRNFIKLLNRVYEAKGTEKALKLLFRTIFNEDVSISYPSEKILKASDGIWERESFVTVLKTFGEPQQLGKSLTISNSSGTFLVEIIRIQNIGLNLYRYYFKSYRDVSISEDNQTVYVYNGNTVAFAGTLLKAPAKLVITQPGTSWQKGQVIVIPGSIKDTIARVTSITSTGGIKSTEILEHGYAHAENQVELVSPFKYKPIGLGVVATSTLIPNTYSYHHELEINDFLFSISESIVGVENPATTNITVLNQTEVTTGVIVGNGNGDASLTIDDWMASRATITFSESNIVNTKGYYKNDLGQLSNQQIKMQDNYFYQAFSYLIETQRDLKEYESVLRITHPAGTKLFAEQSKSVGYIFDVTTSRNASLDVIYLSDSVVVTDINAKNMTHYKADGVTAIDLFFADVKYVVDEVSVTSSENSSVYLVKYSEEDYDSQQYDDHTYQLQLGQ